LEETFVRMIASSATRLYLCEWAACVGSGIGIAWVAADVEVLMRNTS
jgi:hypothetical protein